MPSQYVNQCWVIVNWTLRNKLYWNFDQNTKLFIHENAFENIVYEMAAILSRERWINCYFIPIIFQYIKLFIESWLDLMSIHITALIAQFDRLFSKLNLNYLSWYPVIRHTMVTNLWYLIYWGREKWCHFADNTSKCIFLNENIRISIKIALKFFPRGPINNIPALVQIMAWRRLGGKPLSDSG